MRIMDFICDYEVSNEMNAKISEVKFNICSTFEGIFLENIRNFKLEV